MKLPLRILAGLWLALGFIGGYGLVSAIIDRSPPIDFIDARALSPSAPAGGTIDIHFDVWRHRICPVVKANRVLTDASGAEHAIANYTLATQTRPGRESYDRTITIPEATATGPARYQITITYACNLVHNLGWPIVVASPNVGFTVTPKLDD